MNVPNEFAEFFQGIDLTKREIAFLIWLSEWDQNTIRNMRTVLEKIQAAGVADGASSQPSNEPPPCYQPDGDGCAYQCYDGQDEPIEKCKECPLCCSDKQRNYTSPNKSLTQADLDSMDYDKVWLDYGADGEWALVVHGRIYSLANLEGCGFEEIMRAEVASDTIGCPSGDYTVCRRPPEGEEEQDGGV